MSVVDEEVIELPSMLFHCFFKKQAAVESFVGAKRRVHLL